MGMPNYIIKLTVYSSGVEVGMATTVISNHFHLELNFFVSSILTNLEYSMSAKLYVFAIDKKAI